MLTEKIIWQLKGTKLKNKKKIFIIGLSLGRKQDGTFPVDGLLLLTVLITVSTAFCV